MLHRGFTMYGLGDRLNYLLTVARYEVYIGIVNDYFLKYN